MPALGIGLLAIELCFLVHAIRTGRPSYWFMVIMFLPAAGCLAYFILEILPEMRHSRAGRKAVDDIGKVIDPDRGLRELTTRVARADTVENKSALGRECLAKGRFDDAEQLFQSCLIGLHETDPDLMLGLAQAQGVQAEVASKDVAVGNG